MVDGLISIAEKGKRGEGYNLSGQQISGRDLIQIERTVLGASQSRILNVPVPVVQVSAAVLGRLARWFHFHTIITPYSIAVLLSKSRISNAKATRELGYAPRPIADSIQTVCSSCWKQDNSREKILHPLRSNAWRGKVTIRFSRAD